MSKLIALKEKLAARQPVLSTTIANLGWSGIIQKVAAFNFDMMMFDLEHGTLSVESVENLLRMCRLCDLPSVVRVPDCVPHLISKTLDMGADGIIFPMIKTPDEANRLISYTLYPPHGIRGFGPMNAVDYGIKDIMGYVKEHHKTMCRFIQIEHIDAVRNLDEIIKNEYIDGYIVGANDLSGSMGRLGDVFSDEVTAVIKEVVAKLKAAGKYVGISTGDFSESTLKYWHDMGFDMISAGADFDFLREGFRQNRETLERAHING
jgi:2-dehydro-3-deoxyglucarate aldolase/4-hydroxy-2-oxoheptanedioate aldolase